MIVTVGLTPAWQQILVFDQFRYGEVNRAQEAHWCASGKVFNAGIAAHRLGAPSLTVAVAGGPVLPQIEQDLDSLGVPRRLVHTQAATRVCTTILDRQQGAMTELVENGRPVQPAELDALAELYRTEVARAEVAVIIGSLPAGTPETYYRRLLQSTPCPAVLDFRGQGLLDLLDLRPWLVKPNREELAASLGRELDTDQELLAAMAELNQRGAQWVLVTQGPGPIWVRSEQQTLRVTPPRIQRVVNPIGCGDAMSAGLAWSLHAGKPMSEAVRWAAAASAANLQQLLPCRFAPALIPALAQRVKVEVL